jgi:transcriptional regulator with XRE-family HTH domain
MTERELLRLFSKNVRDYRARNSWSQSELAEMINVSVNFLSDIENSRKWASPVTMVKLSEIFNVEVYELLKPSNDLPDDYGALLSKFTRDIQKVVVEVNGEVETAYTERLVELGRLQRQDKNNND